jgi:hypothetical protein
MELDEKKEHVLRFVKLGLDLYGACICAECTDEEIEVVESDPVFLKKVEVCNIIAEKDLLEKYEIAMRVATNSGKTEPIKWMLEKVNPNRWSDKNKDTGEVFIPANIVLRGGKIERDGEDQKNT